MPASDVTKADAATEHQGGRGARVALVCGDGLPVSGLLTIFRNIVDLVRTECGGIELPITADLGYSWRPDKAVFYPAGAPGLGYPQWLEVTDATPVPDRPGLAEEWLGLRSDIERADELTAEQRTAVTERIEELAAPYEEYFLSWLEKERIDWMVGVNMTLSDATPVTLALHRAAAAYWSDGRPGGLILWDHDLFGSYSVHEGETRVYPHAPNVFTPVPVAPQRWVVPTQQLQDEGRSYPTGLEPTLIPYVLPRCPQGPLQTRHEEFLAQQEIEPTRPVVLVPVRVFRVKGVEVAVRLFADLVRECERRGDPRPVLAVFGSLQEDPDYSREVLTTVEAEGIGDAVRFLGGVPLSSNQDEAGTWRLDEVDLLHVAKATAGGVFYTPNRPDVESVGLGPALAAAARLPFAAAVYNALDGVYGPGWRYVRIEDKTDLAKAARQFADLLAAHRAADPGLEEDLQHNVAQAHRVFPDEPCLRFVRGLGSAL
ncbi:hypothetical protein [Streptomyces sp. bgisy153]|uniref:hypothetical protein n=1 Tax=Streptomyces sp. bgisy153 TaxID=3413793 RepID=UPI003D70B9B6